MALMVRRVFLGRRRYWVGRQRGGRWVRGAWRERGLGCVLEGVCVLMSGRWFCVCVCACVWAAGCEL